MTTGWNNRNDWFNPSDGTNDGSFEEHTERMRGFRRSHADVAMVNGPRRDKPALLESMAALASPPRHDGNRRVKISRRHSGLVGSRSRSEGSTVQAFAKLKRATPLRNKTGGVIAMEIVWNRYRNEQSYCNYMSEGDPFQRYVEGMREFPLARAETEPAQAKARRSLLRLLNLIPIYGMVPLPRNSQN